MHERILKGKIALIACMLTGLAQVQAQEPVLEWGRQIGGPRTEIGRDVVVDTAGNVYATGTFQTTPNFNISGKGYNMTAKGSKDVYITKMDAAGNFIWAKQLGGTGASIDVYSLAVDDSGNVYTTGTFYGTVDFNPDSTAVATKTSAGAGDIFVSKINASGDFVWALQIGGSSEDAGQSVTTDHDGNLYLTGGFSDKVDFGLGNGSNTLTTKGNRDIFILKLKGSGTPLWVKQIGSSSTESGDAVAVDKSGNVYIKGNFQETADFNPGTGSFELITSSASAFVLKLDANGDFVWAGQVVGGKLLNTGRSMVVDACGAVYFTGTFDGTADFDPGTTKYELTKAGLGGDGYIAKWSTEGKFVWAKSLGGPSAEVYPASIALDPDNNVYTTGFYNGLADFDPGTVSVYLPILGGNDIYISQLDANGDYLWAGAMGGSGYEYAIGLATDDYGNWYTTGYFEEPIDINPSANTALMLTALGRNDAFVVKLSGKHPGTGGAASMLISGPDSVCAHQEYTYTVDNFPAATFTWVLPKGWTGNSSSHTITVNTGIENGTISVKAVRGCDTTSQAMSIELRLLPVDITVEGSKLGTTNSGSYSSWQWYLDNDIIDNATDSVYTVQGNGVYRVVVTGNGCSDTASYTVNNTAINLNYAIVNSIHSYPNPVKNTLNVSTTAALTLRITQIDGRILQTLALTAPLNSIRLQHLSKGIYLLSFFSQDGQLLKTEKMIKTEG